MNAFAPAREDVDRDQSMASDECSLWRGRFIEEYSAAEAVVSEALAHLSTIATSGAESLLPHLVGKRFEALGIVVGAKGPLATVGSRVAARSTSSGTFTDTGPSYAMGAARLRSIRPGGGVWS
jgi:hypothetical protein